MKFCPHPLQSELEDVVIDLDDVGSLLTTTYTVIPIPVF